LLPASRFLCRPNTSIMTAEVASYPQPGPIGDVCRKSRNIPPCKIDLSDLFDQPQSYPIIASVDCSPTSEAFPYIGAFHEPYLIYSYFTQPAYSLDDYMEVDFYDRPTTELPSGLALSKNHAVHHSAAAARANVEQRSTISPSFDTAASFDGIRTINDTFLSAYDYCATSSPAATVCGEDSCPPSLTVSSPALSNQSIERETPEPVEDPTPKPVRRKRGRPKLSRSDSDTAGSNGESHKSRPSRRLPHNQVERKYREGLNAELERLRRTVPTLPKRDTRDLTGPPKPSKTTVLASAIDYIKYIEAERDRLTEENNSLRTMRRSDI